MSDDVTEARRALTDHEQMLDAMAGCVLCKLCHGKAVISDAGTGAGYFINCENSTSFHPSKGCLIDQRRLGGWAYNVMDWWNRLHASTPSPDSGERMREAAQRVVDEFPAAAGKFDSIEGADGKPGWGSIRALAAALQESAR